MSGRLLGAHQKIDRLARKSLADKLAGVQFPNIRSILHFEGVNGPDAIKRKSPAQDEPWHYYEPFNDDDTQLIDLLGAHYDQLVFALKQNDDIRAAFEAAWLAHAVVDGLTPAHHYPYEEKLAELRGGEGLETRTNYRNKLIMPGETRLQKMSNNWKMWGSKGLLTTHLAFEWGVAFVIAPLTARRFALKPADIAELDEYGAIGLFKRKAKEIAALELYDAYRQHGWTPRLARKVKNQLLPIIVHVVALAWYAAAIDAGKIKGKRL
jgi:hypothetical protein